MSDGDIRGRVVQGRFDADEQVVHHEQSFASGRKITAWLPVPAEMLADAAAYQSVLDDHLDHTFRPWRYPDRNPFPVIDLFPRWTRFRAFLGRVRRHFAREPWVSPDDFQPREPLWPRATRPAP